MNSRQTKKQAVRVARKELAETLTGAGPRAPATTQEGATKLREAKKGENDHWLRQVSKVFWVGVVLVAASSLVTVHYQNESPASVRQISALSETVQDAAKDLRAVLQGQKDELDADAKEATSAIASDLGTPATALLRSIDELPSTWNGQSLTAERRELFAAATDLGAVGRQLVTTANNVALKDVEGRVLGVEEALKRIEAVDAAPGWTLPWEYEQETAAAFVYAVLLTLILLGALSVLLHKSGGLRFFLIGGDGRFSTSQTQAALWTLAIFFLLAHLLLRREPGDFDTLDENYLLLLGGPYAAWVITGAVTRGKLDKQLLQKVTTPEAQAKDLVCDDNGRASLTDAQFFLFSVLALVGVLVAFAQDPSGLPEINTGLAMLSGASALVYTGRKSLDGNAPAIFSVTRAEGEGPITSGVTILLHGAHFVPPGGGGDLDVLTGVVVRFKVGGSVVDQPVKPELMPDEEMTASSVRETAVNPAPDRLALDVPVLPAGSGTIRVITAAGVETAEHPLHLGARVALQQVVFVPAPGGVGAIRLLGSGLAPDGNRSLTTVAVGSSTAVAFDWESDETLLVPVPQGATGDVVVKVSNHHGTARATLTLP